MKNNRISNGDLAKLSADVKRLSNHPIVIELNVTALITLIGLVQLSLRHPQILGPSADIGRLIIQQLKETLKDYPAIQQLIDRGFDPAYDYVPDQEGK